jgi:hypothetical protein
MPTKLIPTAYTATGGDVQLTQIWISAKGQGMQPLLLTPSPSAALVAPSRPPVGAGFAGEETIDSIIQTALSDPEAVMRLVTVTKLGQRAREDVRAKAVIVQMALSDSDPGVRGVAADMLNSLEEQEELEHEQ